ncbi:argininosuccinate synthase [Marivirga lumbricoides]|uniref:argininosuccinate synthase n=1 Tax=Marivirga lumbricoides TaxID=1046115 RepID=A0A2T4DUH2_9BACT|nr:argininosuccinate synthase [Marivirga lumbricoides]
MNKKALVAFSGGLDTSYCVLQLSKVLDYEVHTITVNTGGFDPEEVAKIAQRANDLGSKSHKTVDVTQKFWDDCLKYLVFGNVLKNNTYPLSVSAERVFQALAIAHYAKEIGVNTVVHGSTGAGNDQVRFDMVLQTIIPGIEIITPIRDNKLSREEEIQFLKSHNVEMDFAKAQYSINKGIWGTSVGGKETLNSRESLPESAYPTQVSETVEKSIKITFKKGIPVALDDQKYEHPVDLVQALNKIGGSYGIGRDIHVGDTIIGIKGRVGFEAPAPVLLIKAHHLLEKHVLTQNQLSWKEQLSVWYGNRLHEGQFLDPTMRNIEKFLADTQENVTGDVWVKLYPYRFAVEGIESKYDLMSSEFGKYGEENTGWSGEDVKGFTKIFGNQTAIYHQVKNKADD